MNKSKKSSSSLKNLRRSSRISYPVIRYGFDGGYDNSYYSVMPSSNNNTSSVCSAITLEGKTCLQQTDIKQDCEDYCKTNLDKWFFPLLMKLNGREGRVPRIPLAKITNQETNTFTTYSPYKIKIALQFKTSNQEEGGEEDIYLFHFSWNQDNPSYWTFMGLETKEKILTVQDLYFILTKWNESKNRASAFSGYLEINLHFIQRFIPLRSNESLQVLDSEKEYFPFTNKEEDEGQEKKKNWSFRKPNILYKSISLS